MYRFDRRSADDYVGPLCRHSKQAKLQSMCCLRPYSANEQFLRATAYMYAIARICHANFVRPSVCPSLCLTHVYCIKTAERIIEILSPSDRPIILVFRHQGSLRESDGFTQRGCQIQRGSNFRRICGYISERVLDRGYYGRRIQRRMCSIE